MDTLTVIARSESIQAAAVMAQAILLVFGGVVTYINSRRK